MAGGIRNQVGQLRIAFHRACLTAIPFLLKRYVYMQQFGFFFWLTFAIIHINDHNLYKFFHLICSLSEKYREPKTRVFVWITRVFIMRFGLHRCLHACIRGREQLEQQLCSKQDGCVEAGLITSLSHAGLGDRLTSMHMSLGLNLLT